MTLSRYEQLLDTWCALGGQLPSRKGPAWNWKPHPTYEWLLTHLAHAPMRLP